MPAQVLEHDGYRELHLSGRLMRDLLSERLEGLAEAPRILIDYGDVTGIDLPLEQLVELTKKNDAKGLRIAVYAPTPLAFGWNRQVLQLAGAREGVTVSVFKERDLAVAWLVAEGAVADGFGGSSRTEPPFLARLA
ncbi:MAG: hypothetical protein WD557_16295 [Dehalococcoidia bacterium]